MFKRIFFVILICSLVLSGCNPNQSEKKADFCDSSFESAVTIEKPVIYLYGYNGEVSVKLTTDANTEITSSYPPYPSNGWSLYAKKNMLSDKTGREYYGLYYEVESDNEFSFDSGFCFKGSKTREFLEIITKMLGLNYREAEEFIIYWLPQMEKNNYNVVSFQTIPWQKSVKITTEPAADAMIRICMAWYGSDEAVKLPRQQLRDLSDFERKGKILVEWGGFEDKKLTYEHTAHEEETFFMEGTESDELPVTSFGPHTITDKYGVTYTFSDEEWAILLDAWGWAGPFEFFIEKQSVESLKNIINLRKMEMKGN